MLLFGLALKYMPTPPVWLPVISRLVTTLINAGGASVLNPPGAVVCAPLNQEMRPSSKLFLG